MNFPEPDFYIRYKEAGPRYNVRPHRHNYYQWYCLVSGDVLITLERSRNFVLSPGQSAIVPPNTTRQYQFYRNNPGYIVADFTSPFPFGNIAMRALSLPENLETELGQLLTELKSKPNFCRNDLLHATFVKIIVGLLRSYMTTDKRSAASPMNLTYYQEIVDSVEKVMYQNVHRSLTLEKLAKQVNMSSSHLARVFKSTTGKTLITRFVEIRMKHAKKLLLNTSIPTTQIASEVGYNSYSHFVKVFTKSAEVSPSVFRKKRGHVWLR